MKSIICGAVTVVAAALGAGPAFAQKSLSVDELTRQLTPSVEQPDRVRSMSRGISTITPDSLQTSKPVSNTVSMHVEFDTDRATLRPDGRQELDKLAESMNKVRQKVRTRGMAPDQKLVLSLVGHTDERGSDDHNDALSRARAEEAARYLRDTWGFKPDEIVIDYKGKRQPISNQVPCDSACLQENRRVDVQTMIR